MSAQAFLDQASLRDLTGKVYAPAQIRVLEKRRIKYELDARGRPKVLWAQIEKRQLGTAVTEAPGPQPDFSAFPAVV